MVVLFCYVLNDRDTDDCLYIFHNILFIYYLLRIVMQVSLNFLFSPPHFVVFSTYPTTWWRKERLDSVLFAADTYVIVLLYKSYRRDAKAAQKAPVFLSLRAK